MKLSYLFRNGRGVGVIPVLRKVFVPSKPVPHLPKWHKRAVKREQHSTNKRYALGSLHFTTPASGQARSTHVSERTEQRAIETRRVDIPTEKKR